MDSACLVNRSPWTGGDCCIELDGTEVLPVVDVLALDDVDCNASFCDSSSNEALEEDDDADANDTVDEDTPFDAFEILGAENDGMLFVVVRNFRGSITC